MRWDGKGEAPWPDRSPDEWATPEGEYDLRNLAAADELLFGRGMMVDDYFIDDEHGFELICFVGKDGRDFDLHVSDERLKVSAIARLRELGARVKS